MFAKICYAYSHMTQETALEILKTGVNVFLTGEPGSGKTYAINQYIAWLEAANLKVAVTASTGIAATHIGGLTIHSWSGVGTRDTLSRYDLDQIATKEKLVRRIKKTHVLIIDEVSMLDGKLLDMVDVICRTIRQSTEAFGGMQVVCVGDFFQLPPIGRIGEATRYAFESHAWDRLRPLVCYLTEQHRQEDELLLSLLGSIRRGEIEEDHYTLLREQVDIAYEGIEPTRLYTHNADVDAVNVAKLKELGGMTKTYHMSGRGNKIFQESLMRNCLSPQALSLKEEAMVMCTKNNFEAGYVNGTLARVVGFDAYEGYPIIETADKRRITIEPVAWEVAEDGKIVAAIEQVPLRLAWAITVHKSQGMSLDAAEVDLSKSFVYGQGYVALSRVRSLAGLKVLGMNPNALMVDPKIIAQDVRFRTESEAAEETFEALDEPELHAMHERFVKASGGTLPTQAAVEAQVSVSTHERLARESTYEQTLALLAETSSLEDLAKKRQLAVTTIVSHLEQLAEDKRLTVEQVEKLLLAYGAPQEARQAILTAIHSEGVEKLKPIFEATSGEFDYVLIRLVRLLVLCEQST
jgi:ATP-dependent DNA helicase PIF1